MKRIFKIIVAGGKTGGHLFPGISIAQAILRMEPDAQILFVGTGEPFETGTLSRYGFTHKRIFSAGIKGKGIVEKIRALLQIPISLIQASAIVRRFRPDIVVGVGGFSSGPVVLGARLCGVKTAIQEQNSIAGITNRILARFAHVIFTSFKETKGLAKNRRVIHTGNPIRRAKRDPVKESGGNNLKKDRKFTILVTGGSQGAKSINSAFIDALKLLKDLEQYSIVHQTGAADEERVLMAYKKMAGEKKFNNVSDLASTDTFKNGVLNLSARAFFNNLPEIQALADLIICRAGAGTISEITAIGKAALLVPYPYAADDHQTYNARALADGGAGWMIPDHKLSGEFLKDKIEFAHAHPDLLSQMAQRAKALGNPYADDMIASICIKMGRGLS